MITDSLPYGGDMDETLQPQDHTPDDWLHTAPMQKLLASEGESLPARPVATPMLADESKLPVPAPLAEENMGMKSKSLGSFSNISIKLQFENTKGFTETVYPTLLWNFKTLSVQLNYIICIDGTDDK